jgi:protein-tyrosine phosphatase
MTFREPYQPLLAGGCNVRDLGGHETIDGREVRKGVIYRSGVLSYLTPSDHCCLARSQIRTIVDLRRPDEIDEEPTSWQGPARIATFEPDEAVAASQRSAAWLDAKSVEDVRIIMRTTYGSMHEWLAAPLRAIFQAIADGELALLFHCAAGKDRTGFCAAMILGLVGVSRDTLLQEYAYTDRAIDLAAFARQHRAARLGLADARDPLDAMDPEARAALIRADPEYLAAAIDSVLDRYGSIEGYVRQGLGLTDEQIEVVRYQLLED